MVGAKSEPNSADGQLSWPSIVAAALATTDERRKAFPRAILSTFLRSPFTPDGCCSPRTCESSRYPDDIGTAGIVTLIQHLPQPQLDILHATYISFSNADTERDALEWERWGAVSINDV